MLARAFEPTSTMNLAEAKPAPVHVLAVDDDPSVRQLIADYLADNDIQVTAVGSGKAIADVMSRATIDLLILDLKLPGEDGMQIARTLRADSDVPIIMLTGRKDEADRVMGLELGADDYLTKPFAFAELFVRVKALLRRGAVNQKIGRSHVLHAADLELDRLSQQVRRAGQRIELTGKEYALLEYLMLNAGRVLSRTMIIEHVWDQSFDGATNIVDVYVRHLRNKVDEAHERKLIRTVRGVGYAISDEEEA
jgi:DNA-binding response OmpR family regulator